MEVMPAAITPPVASLPSPWYALPMVRLDAASRRPALPGRHHRARSWTMSRIPGQCSQMSSIGSCHRSREKSLW